MRPARSFSARVARPARAQALSGRKGRACVSSKAGKTSLSGLHRRGLLSATVLGVERDADSRFGCSSAGPMIAAMMRRAPHWITNVKQGGSPSAVVPDPMIEARIAAAAEAVGAEIAGVDILMVPPSRPTVLEVNSMPAWSGLQKVTKLNIAAVVATELVTASVNAAQQGARRSPQPSKSPPRSKPPASRNSTPQSRATCTSLHPATEWRIRIPGQRERRSGSDRQIRRPCRRTRPRRRRCDARGGRRQHQPRHHSSVRAARGRCRTCAAQPAGRPRTRSW